MSVEADRIERLEFELAHQQRITEQLNEVVTEQNRQLFRIGRDLDQLKKQITDLKQRPTSDPAPTLEDEKPPHY